MGGNRTMALDSAEYINEISFTDSYNRRMVELEALRARDAKLITGEAKRVAKPDDAKATEQ